MMEVATGYQSFDSFLKNSYWILRHGKSIPNERGIIVSSLENGILDEYQLAGDGVSQARSAGESFLKALKSKEIDVQNVRICYSPFSRTRHTANVVASVLDIPFEGSQCRAISQIRERYFGPSFELKSHEKYAEIWALDEKDPFMRPEGGESVADVSTRLATALEIMESEFDGCTILVVSHGDPLQILQTIFDSMKKDGNGDGADLKSKIVKSQIHSVLSQHRKFALETGELRQLL